MYLCFKLMRRQRHHHNSFVRIMALSMSHHFRRQRVSLMTLDNVQRNIDLDPRSNIQTSEENRVQS